MLRLFKLTPLFQVELKATLTVTRGEVKTMRSWLETRMSHCEMERENRTTTKNGHPKFNPDTYIGQKLLLLDLRELLLGDIVD